MLPLSNAKIEYYTRIHLLTDEQVLQNQFFPEFTLLINTKNMHRTQVYKIDRDNVESFCRDKVR